MEYKKRRLGAWALRSTPKVKHTNAQHQVHAKHIPASKHPHHWHFPVLLTFSLTGLSLLLWILGGVYLSNFNISGTRVSGRASNAALQTVINDTMERHRLTLVYPDKSQKSFSLAEMGIESDASLTVRTLRQEQDGLMARLRWWQPIAVPFQVTVKGSALHSFIGKNAIITAQPAKDATLVLENGDVKMVDSVTGKQYGLNDPGVSLIKAAQLLQTKPLYLQTLAVTPAVTSEQLTSSKERIEKILTQNITFIIDNRTVTPKSSDIAAWLELTPDEKAGTVDVTVNSGKVLDYINKIAAKDIRPPRAEVVIARSDGSRHVLVPGVNGIDVTNKQDVATKVTNDLPAGRGMEVKLPINYAGYKTITAGDYEKWIEVDVTNKRMYAYNKSNLAKTFLISAGAPATPTVIGQYAIYSKRTQQTMTGLNADGSRYRQPNVPWVSYFYRDYAIHGNYWRPLSYFGNINSSHGCVGITVGEGQWLYDWAPVGTPVIVHK